jgi:DNA invertase Pin-like site-specific DNA recombinase
MIFGYARVSTHQQELALQIDALKQAGCDRIFEEKLSATAKDRPQLDKLLDQLRPEDTVIVWKLDRLGRSLKNLIELVTLIEEKGAAFKSLNDQIDTTTSHGKLIFNIFASLAEFERDMIRERTRAGLAAARARGRQGGRPKGLSKKAHNTAILAEKLYLEQKMTVKEICEQLAISKGTFYNYLKLRGVPVSKGVGQTGG